MASQDIFSVSGSEQGPLGPRRSDQPVWAWPSTPSPLSSTWGEHFPQQASAQNTQGRRCFTTGRDSTLSLYSGDNVIFYPTKLLFTPNHCKERAYNFARVPTGRKRENTLSSSLSEFSLLLRRNSLASQRTSTVANPDTILYHPWLKACLWSDLSVRALPIPHPQVMVETWTLVAFQNHLDRR